MKKFLSVALIICFSVVSNGNLQQNNFLMSASQKLAPPSFTSLPVSPIQSEKSGRTLFLLSAAPLVFSFFFLNDLVEDWVLALWITAGMFGGFALFFVMEKAYEDWKWKQFEKSLNIQSKQGKRLALLKESQDWSGASFEKEFNGEKFKETKLITVAATEAKKNKKVTFTFYLTQQVHFEIEVKEKGEPNWDNLFQEYHNKLSAARNQIRNQKRTSLKVIAIGMGGLAGGKIGFAVNRLVNSLKESTQEENLFMPNGELYPIYGVFGSHETEEDGRLRVKKIEKIFNLARKANKKIIFLQEILPTPSLIELKEANPEISSLTEDDLIHLYMDPVKVHLFKNYFRNVCKKIEEFEEKIKELYEKQIKSNKKTIEKIKETEKETIERQKKIALHEKDIMKTQKEMFINFVGSEDYGKPLKEFLKLNSDILQQFVKEYQVLDIESNVEVAITGLKSSYFFEKAHSFYETGDRLQSLAMKKKSILFDAQCHLLRDKGIADWLKKNMGENTIIVYERGVGHAYMGWLEKSLGEKHKMVFTDDPPELIDWLPTLKKKYAQYPKIIEDENVLNTPENEALILSLLKLKIKKKSSAFQKGLAVAGLLASVGVSISLSQPNPCETAL